MAQPAARPAPPGPAPEGADDLRAEMDHLRGAFRRAAVHGVAASLLALAPSWYMMEVYDRVVNSRSGMTLAMLTVAVLLMYGLAAVQEWARGALLQAAARDLDTRLGPRVFDAALAAVRRRQPHGGPQALHDLRTVRDFVASPVCMAVFEVPMVGVCLVLLYLLSPWLAAVAVGAVALQALLGWMNERQGGASLQQANQHGQAAQAWAERVLAQAPVVLASGMLPGVRQRWLQRQREALALQARASRSSGAWQAGSRLLQNLVTSGLLGLSAWLLLHDALHGGGAMLVVSGIVGGRAMAPFVQVIGQWGTVQQARQAWDRLARLLQAEPAPAASMPLPAPQGALRVEQVGLSVAGSSAPVLDGLNFGLQRGEVLAVIGPSGSGKSTLARLLLGAMPATQGKVRLDGVDVAQWPKAELGAHVGYLPQGIELLDGTLAENIARFGEPSPTGLDRVIDLTGLQALADSLPDGLATRLGPNGARLSGGQRQRVGLARALYGAPALVVLDEPDAHLDEDGDAALLRIIDTCRRQGTTFVVMTHRPSVLQVADRLLILHEGRQKAFGPRDEVLAALRRAGEQVQQARMQQQAACAA